MYISYSIELKKSEMPDIDVEREIINLAIKKIHEERIGFVEKMQIDVKVWQLRSFFTLTPRSVCYVFF